MGGGGYRCVIVRSVSAAVGGGRVPEKCGSEGKGWIRCYKNVSFAKRALKIPPLLMYSPKKTFKFMTAPVRLSISVFYAPDHNPSNTHSLLRTDTFPSDGGTRSWLRLLR